MAIQVSSKRKFKMCDKNKSTELEDPNISMSIEDVVAFYANKYPELTTASIIGPELENDYAVYTFKTVLGDKG
jgi:PRTRC genetic system protein C